MFLGIERRSRQIVDAILMRWYTTRIRKTRTLPRYRCKFLHICARRKPT